MKPALLIGLCICALIVGTAVPSMAVSYKLVDLGIAPNMVESEAHGINGSGEVVGWSMNADNRARAFYWSSSTGFVTFDPQAGDERTYAYAINDSGLIAGCSGVTGQDYEIAIWRAGVGVVALGPRYTDARAINSAGDTAGRAASNVGGTRSADGTITPINSSSLAYGINNLGEVVGIAPGSNAFYWSLQTGLLGIGGGVACDINDSGKIVGYSGGDAYAWDRTGNARVLPKLPGYSQASAWSVNNIGQVVGSLGGLAVLWGADDTVAALPTLDGFTHTYARSISENGLIAGEAMDASGNKHAVLWTLVPEPAGVLALATGLLGVVPAIIRRRGCLPPRGVQSNKPSA